VTCLAEAGSVILADGGSISGFADQLRGIPGVTVSATPGTGPRLVAQVRLALTMAGNSGSPYVLYTEPDKQAFFEHRLMSFLDTVTASRADTGISFPARDAASFATFPPGQQSTERLFNDLASETLGITSDFLYGPLLIRSDLLPHLEDLPIDLGWGWRIFLLTVTHRLGLPLLPWVADLPCPSEQRGEDDEQSRTYRIEQLAQNVRGLALGRKKSLQGL
jgi:hypothetical protein